MTPLHMTTPRPIELGLSIKPISVFGFLFSQRRSQIFFEKILSFGVHTFAVLLDARDIIKLRQNIVEQVIVYYRILYRRDKANARTSLCSSGAPIGVLRA